MNSIYRTSLRIPPSDIDFSNRLKVNALFNYVQNAASAHAEQLNLGYREMQAAGLFWVLSWMRVELDGYPHYQQEVTVTTWPKGRYRIFSLRDFLFSTAEGEVFCRARSAWLPVEASSKRVVSLDRLPRPVPYNPDRTALDELPSKIPEGEKLEDVYEHQIRYSDLDLNQHVNNARYVELLWNCYPLEFHRDHRLRALTFSFQSESRYGDRLILSRGADPLALNRHRVAARQAEGERVVFQALVDWEPE